MLCSCVPTYDLYHLYTVIPDTNMKNVNNLQTTIIKVLKSKLSDLMKVWIEQNNRKRIL